MNSMKGKNDTNNMVRGLTHEIARGFDLQTVLVARAHATLTAFTRDGTRVYACEDKRSIVFETVSGNNAQRGLPKGEEAAYISSEGSEIFVITMADKGAPRYANEREDWKCLENGGAHGEEEKIWRLRSFAIREGRFVREDPVVRSHTSSSPPNQWFPI